MTSQLVKGAVISKFPGAMPGNKVVDLMLDSMKQYGIRKNNVVYGMAICPDEINGNRGHVTTILTRYYGRNFFVGGLGGAPYVGKTGFMAFSHHVPDDGNVVIVFGPHIGFSPEGEPGKFLRKGQDKLSTSCGAVIAAYGQCTSSDKMPKDEQDLEQSWLREKLGPHCAALSSSKNPMPELVMKAYKEVEEEMLAIVNTDFGK